MSENILSKNGIFLWLFCIVGVSIIIKLFVSTLIQSPYIFLDELVYVKMASSYFHSGQFIVYGIPASQYPPLYPMVLSIGFIFHNMETIYIAFKVINAIISSLIIIPIWLLAREFVNDMESSVIAILSALLPMTVYSSVLMSENLFFPLFFCSIYLILKSLTGDRIFLDILCGLSIGLCYLTKITGFLLIIPFIMGIMIISGIAVSRNSRPESGCRFYYFFLVLFLCGIWDILKKKWAVLITAILIILPWIIRNTLLFGISLRGILGNYYNEVIIAPDSILSPSSFIWFTINHFSYLSIGSAIIFFTGALFITFFLISDCRYRENEKLTVLTAIVWSVTLSFIIISSYHVLISTSTLQDYFRIQGRYITQVLPLFLILGFVGLKKMNSEASVPFNIRYDIMLLISLAITSGLLIFSPFEFLGNQAITSAPDILFLKNLGVSEIIIRIMLVLIPINFFVLYRFGVLKIQYFIPFVLIFLLGSSAVAYEYNIGMSHWLDREKEIGKFFSHNSMENSTILIDNRDPGSNSVLKWTLEFWTDDTIISDDLTNETLIYMSDYVISSHNISFTPVYTNKKWTVYSTPRERSSG